MRREDKMTKRMVEVLVDGRYHGSIVVWVYRSWNAERIASRVVAQVSNYVIFEELDASKVSFRTV